MPQKVKRLAEDTPNEGRYTVKDLPPAERPRERLLENGPGALSTTELVAILLRIGTHQQRVTELASDLLAKYGGLSGLHRASPVDLCQENGLGPAKVSQLLAALEIGRRLQQEADPEPAYSIRSPESVADFLRLEMGHLDREDMVVLLLDNKHRVAGKPIQIYKGNASGAVIRPAELFREAVRQNCIALVLAHNHPSGDPTPSAEDIEVTRQVLEAGSKLDIAVLDHLVIGRSRFCSLRRERPSLPWPA